MKKEKNNEFNSIQEDITTLAGKEEEIRKSYNDIEEEIVEEVYEEDIEDSNEEDIEDSNEEYIEDNTDYTNQTEDVTYEEEPVIEETIYEYDEDDEITKLNRKYKRTKRIINIVFSIIVIILVMIATDVICVSKYQKGPFFSLPLHTYNDGGTKEYYGIGYKVIKYNQIQGRRDLEIGSWSLKYNANPVTSQAVDMAIEFYDNTDKAYKKYNKKFVRIISTLNKVDTKKHQIEIGYKDEGGKYSLDITCNMVKDQKNLSTLEEEKEITIIGTVNSFKPATNKSNNKLIINNCFAEQ